MLCHMSGFFHCKHIDVTAFLCHYVVIVSEALLTLIYLSIYDL